MRKRTIVFIGIGVELVLLLFIFSFWQEKKGINSFRQETNIKASVSVNETGSPAEGEPETGEESKQDYIKWVEFNVTCEALTKAYTYDVESYGKEVHLDWIDLLACLAAKYGGDFGQYRAADMETLADRLSTGKETLEDITKDMKYFSYYRQAYGAVLHGMIGKYEIEQEKDGKKTWKKYYGLKAFSPIAETFPYSDYDDFGVSRSYGYKRNHLGHDMMGQVGTPIIAMQSGYIAVMGWNQYGGWRIGINSFDGRRYDYYAHLRQNRPFAEGLQQGDVVQAGDVIGYMGRTGYSTTENVNNIDTSHLHFGMQLIFDESQRQGNGEIWVNVYPLIQFLRKNTSEVLRNDASKEWYRKYNIRDYEAQKEIKKQEKKNEKGKTTSVLSPQACIDLYCHL